MDGVPSYKAGADAVWVPLGGALYKLSGSSGNLRAEFSNTYQTFTAEKNFMVLCSSASGGIRADRKDTRSLGHYTAYANFNKSYNASTGAWTASITESVSVIADGYTQYFASAGGMVVLFSPDGF